MCLMQHVACCIVHVADDGFDLPLRHPVRAPVALHDMYQLALEIVQALFIPRHVLRPRRRLPDGLGLQVARICQT